MAYKNKHAIGMNRVESSTNNARETSGRYHKGL